MKCFAGSGADEESARHVAKQEKIMSEIIRAETSIITFLYLNTM